MVRGRVARASTNGALRRSVHGRDQALERFRARLISNRSGRYEDPESVARPRRAQSRTVRAARVIRGEPQPRFINSASDGARARELAVTAVQAAIWQDRENRQRSLDEVAASRSTELSAATLVTRSDRLHRDTEKRSSHSALQLVRCSATGARPDAKGIPAEKVQPMRHA